eukprot:gene7052-11215_t
MLRAILFPGVPITIATNVYLVRSHFEHLEHPTHQAPPQERVDYVTERMVEEIKDKVENSKEELIEKVCPKIHGARVCKKILKNDALYNKFVETLKNNETPKFKVSEIYASHK